MEQTIEYKGYEIEIIQDEYAENPNGMGDTTLGFLVYDHRQFYVKVDGAEPRDVYENTNDKGMYEFQGSYMDKPADYKVYPVYAYIHSGVALSLGAGTDRWDTSMAGFLLLNTEQYEEDKLDEIAQSYIDEWNDYNMGNCWGFKVTDRDGEDVDSCWGFVGDADYPIEEAKGIVDHCIKQEMLGHLKQLKTWIRNRVPYQYRTANTYL